MEQPYKQREIGLRSLDQPKIILIMDERVLTHKFSHWLLRLIAAVNITYFTLDTLSPMYYRMLERMHVAHAVVAWLVVSSFALPIYVLIEMFWLFKNSIKERRAILIDGAFAVFWFLMLWSISLYSLFHTVWL